ncbi:MAG TPA: secondary thiamine-phosphate synthase enzyme YjbQ [Candidatus Obscuribacterales bacterium]
MKVVSETIKLSTNGHTDVVDITSQVATIVHHSRIEGGIATIFVVGSTAGITTIEYEPGLVNDIKEAFERIAPLNAHYDHHERWGDDNGHSHIRASLLGPSITVPFCNKKLILGTWQQIILIDFDTRRREREIVVQLLGA